ncbi:MAG: hypothetical protein ACE5EF_13195 [Dehalococcoidia bacterium]
MSVEILYQSIGYRWAENLRRYDTTEAVAFMGYYDRAENLPLLVASDTEVVE